MADINLPPYKTILPNEVFGRKAEPLVDIMVGEVPTTLVARLTRFKIPTEDEIIDLIVKYARETDIHSLGNEGSEDDLAKTHFMRLLPVPEIIDIAKKDKDSLQHLRRHYSKSDLWSGRSYIGVLSGTVPNRVLDAAKELLEKDSEVYEKAIRQAGACEWNLTVRLEENGALPNSLELEYLLNRGVRESDVFSAHGDFKNYQTVANQVRLIYGALNSPKIITGITDRSYQFLEESAEKTIKETAQCIASKDVMGGLAGIIGQILGSMGVEEQEEQREPQRKSRGGDCSLN